MLKLSELKLSKLSSDKYKDVKFKLHYITDISTKAGENRYHAIFKSIKAKADFDITEEIYPELLNYYIIGTLYQKGERVDKSEYLEPLHIKFPLSDGKIVKIKEINGITKHNINNGNEKYARVIENQYAYLGRLNEYYVIIPCHVIGSAFYYTSATMRQRIFVSKTEKLYYETGFDKINNCPYIILNENVPDSDAVFAYFYTTNKSAEIKWYSIKNNLYAKKKALDDKKAYSGFVPLKIDFPIEGNFDIYAIGLKDEQSKRIFIYKILNAESLVYNYEKIIIRRYSNKNKDIEERTKDVPQNFTYRTKTKITGIISNEAPSYKNSKKIIEDDDDNFFGIYKIKEIINRKDEKKDKNDDEVNVISGKESKDLSLSQLRDANNKDVSPAETKKTDDNYFTFDDFKELMNMFKDKYSSYIKENSAFIATPVKFPVERKKKRFNSKESYDGKNLRDYITARFVYINNSAEKHFLLIELDQKASNGFSTFIFIGNSTDVNDETEDFLKEYAKNVNFYKIQKAFEKQGIRLIRKKHPEKGDKKERFEAWCGDLERKLRYI
ncbi:MAG: hypothetical protein ACYCSQ_04875 [bacterium]